MNKRLIESILIIILIFLHFINTTNAQSVNKQKANAQITNTVKWQWADSLDAVKAAPENHKVIFENDKIRILEVILKPYELEPMHTHRYPSVMFGSNRDTTGFNIIYYRYAYDSANHEYFVKDSIIQHGGRNTSYQSNYKQPEGPHQIKNLSNVTIDVFRVEFKK